MALRDFRTLHHPYHTHDSRFSIPTAILPTFASQVLKAAIASMGGAKVP